MDAALRQALEAAIARATGAPFAVRDTRPIQGGCISEVLYLRGDAAAYVAKLGPATRTTAFAAEAAGLQEWRDVPGVRVPAPVIWGQAGGWAYLVLEYLPMQAPDGRSQAALGRHLAELHRRPRSHYGWHRDNTIGDTPQANTPGEDWLTFWRECRLAPQLALAQRQGYDGRLQALGTALLDRLPDWLGEHRPDPVLLHGDLWSGNCARIVDGAPVLFDPATYYGDRETDLAMTELFGGFSSDFYEAYQSRYPLDADYPRRRPLYQLYHVLNHLNLFGGGYQRQAERLMEDLLAER